MMTNKELEMDIVKGNDNNYTPENDIDILGICDLLEDFDNYQILCHRHPDPDTLGSAAALCAVLRFMGKNAEVICADERPDCFSYILPQEIKRQACGQDTNIICVDVANCSMMGGIEHPVMDDNPPLLKIDHHAVGEDYGDYNYTDPKASSASEIIFEIAEEMGLFNGNESEYTKLAIDAIYTGIAGDTGCFRFSNTTPKTFTIASALAELGADMGRINTVLFESKPLSKVRATAVGLGNMKIVQDGRIAYTVVDNQLKQRGGFSESDFEDLVGKMREIEGVELAYMIRQSGSNPGEYKISSRSKEFFDCTELCGIFGGGGHLRAAGATVSASNPSIAERLVLNNACSLMERYIKEQNGEQ